MNWLQYIYTRERRNFGRQCLFTDRNELLFDVPSDYELISDYILRNPVHTGTQLNTQMALSECNTENATYAHRGMQHTEGGWPKDVNFLDEEQTLRYRKKIEREESWGKQVLALTKPAMHGVLQNSAVNIYQDYFEDMGDVNNLVDNYAAHEIGIFRDKVLQSRCVRHLSFNPVTNNLLATYGTFEHYPDPKRQPPQCYVWDITNSNQPISTLRPPSIPTMLEWCPKDINFIAGGLANGGVSVFDYRSGEHPVAVSPLEGTHREGVSALCFVHSKSNREFYTGSIGGAIFYWDARYMESPVNRVLLDPEKTDDQRRARAHGCTVLEFEYTIPIRYMAGSDHGYLFLGNRKGLTPTETLVANFRVMSGPIRSLERNPVFVKNFLVIGDWCCKIWTEECKDNPIIRTKNHTSPVSCGTWSKIRCSLFFTAQQDGTLHLWDLVMDNHKPIYSMQITNGPITALKGGINGRLLGIGTKTGMIHLVKVDEALTYNLPKERLFVGAMFERETRRIKLLEGRIREIKLKMAQEKKEQKNIPFFGEEEAGIEEEGQKEEVEEEAEIVSEASEIDEEGEEEQYDSELVAIRNKFFELITDEEEKRRDKKYTLLARTAFDPNFVVFDVEESKYKPAVSSRVVDDATRTAELKAMIEERRTARKSVYTELESKKKDETQEIEAEGEDVEENLEQNQEEEGDEEAKKITEEEAKKITEEEAKTVTEEAMEKKD